MKSITFRNINLLLLVLCGGTLSAQINIHLRSDSAATAPKFSAIKGKGLLVTAAHTSFLAGSYILLNKAWYADYPQQSFHFFNDNKEWNQMDKAGHVWTAYHTARASAATWKWAGLSSKKSVVLGGVSALAYQSIIEIQDGSSAQWGFSWGDMAANIVGATAFVAQQLARKEQCVQIKLSYWGYNYSLDLAERRNQLFGKKIQERLLKDYNSQTYWLSANLRSFFPNSKIPKWLNLSAGYGSDGLLGGFVNRWTDKQGNYIDRTDILRVRRFYLSPDIDLTRIPTSSKFLKSFFFVISIFKVPAPALMLDSKGKWKAYALYY